MLGDGERACMSMARFGQEVIASSNFRDVAPYCDENGIEYIGTLDVLTIAILLFIRRRNTSVRFDSEEWRIMKNEE